MTSQERIVNVSVDNINSQIETMLRALGAIDDNESDVELSFGPQAKGFSVVTKGLKPTDVIPVIIKSRKEVKPSEDES